MRIYETTFILSPQADDAAFDRQVKSVAELISRYNGRVLDEDRWGIRRLAYPIKKFTQGYYTRMIFKGDSTLLGELERFYRIEEPYIRYLTVLYEGKLEGLEEQEEKLEEKPVPKEEPALPPVTEVETPAETTPVETEAVETAKPIEAPEIPEKPDEEL
jgi:small subunit ribosomal protein S6